MSTRLIGSVLAIVILGSFCLARPTAQVTPRVDHVAWVAEALKQMQTIKAGMTRKELLVVFTTEGGLFTPLHRTL